MSTEVSQRLRIRTRLSDFIRALSRRGQNLQMQGVGRDWGVRKERLGVWSILSGDACQCE